MIEPKRETTRRENHYRMKGYNSWIFIVVLTKLSERLRLHVGSCHGMVPRLLWFLLLVSFVRLVHSDINVQKRQAKSRHHFPYRFFNEFQNASTFLQRHKNADINEQFQKSKQIQIQSRCTEEYIQLGPSNRIIGTASEDSEYANITIQYGPYGIIRILGKENKFMCFSKKGRLILRRNPRKDRCIFIEKIVNGTSLFKLVTKLDWAVGFRKKNGRPLPGHKFRKTRRKCFEFVVRDVDKSDKPFSPIQQQPRYFWQIGVQRPNDRS